MVAFKKWVQGGLVLGSIISLGEGMISAEPIQAPFCRAKSSPLIRNAILTSDGLEKRLRPMAKTGSRFNFLVPSIAGGELPPAPLQEENFAVLLDTNLRPTAERSASIKVFVGHDETNWASLQEIPVDYTISDACLNFLTFQRINFDSFYDTQSLVVIEVTSPNGAQRYFGDFFNIERGAGFDTVYAVDGGPGSIIRVGNAAQVPVANGNSPDPQMDEGGCSIHVSGAFAPSLLWLLIGCVGLVILRRSRSRRGEFL